jgi:hypothetical protein
LFGVCDLGLDGHGTDVGFHSDHVGAQFVHDGLGVINLPAFNSA